MQVTRIAAKAVLGRVQVRQVWWRGLGNWGAR